MRRALLLLACAACKPGSLDETVCGTLGGGSGVAVTAVDTGEAPSLMNDGKRYDVTLADAEEGKRGLVRFAPTKEDHYVMYLTAAMDVNVVSSDGRVAGPSTIALGVPKCSAAKGRVSFQLTPGTYTFVLGPTDAASVGVLIAPQN